MKKPTVLQLTFFIALLFASMASRSQRPNVIYIMSDDHDNDAISAYNKKFIQTPNIDRLANEGMKFNKAFVGNSICSPSRATLLTGQHSHKNGVKDNFTRFDSSKNNLPKVLQQAGYQTAIIGKWHLHSYPTGFDYWKILPGMGQYFDTRIINMGGDTVTEKGYATDVLTNDALDWLDHRDTAKPFVLFFHHKAPHRNFIPSLKYLEMYRDKVFPEPETLYEDTTGHGSAWRIQTMNILSVMLLSTDLKVDPAYLADNNALRPDPIDKATYNAILNRYPADQRERFKEIYAERGKLLQRLRPQGKELMHYKYQWYMQDYLACVASIDESIGRVLDYLDNHQMTNTTAVVYTSDQGFYLGENGWFDKKFAYDVSMGTPLLVRWPGHIPAHTQTDAMVQNIDFAPTILDITGTSIPHWMQGTSFKPILTQTKKTLDRKYLYYHYYEFGKDHTVLPHVAIRGERYKLIYFYTVDEWELYDLQKDAAEQLDLIHDASYTRILAQMKKELDHQRDIYDDHETAGELH